MCSIGVPAAPAVFLCVECVCSLRADVGFLWVSPTIDIQDRWPGDCKWVWIWMCVFVILVMDWPSVQGFSCQWPMLQPPYDHRTSARENVCNRWMDGCTVRVLVIPLSAAPPPPTNMSSLIHVSKENHSEAIHPLCLSKDHWEKKKMTQNRTFGLAFRWNCSCVWNNYYSNSKEIFC